MPVRQSCFLKAVDLNMSLRKCNCRAIQQRWLFSIIAAVMYMLKAMVQTSIAVTLVAMVNHTEISLSASENTCAFISNDTENIKKLASTAPVYHWSRQMQGYILSAHYWGSLPFQIFVGNIAQRFGGKWVVASGALATAICEFFKPLCAGWSPIHLLIICVMQGAACSLIGPGVFAMFGRWFPPQELSGLSTLSVVGSSLGVLIGLILSGAISTSQSLGGWPVVFYFNGTLSLIGVLAWCLLASSSPGNHPCIRSDELQYIQESLESKQQVANEAGIPWRQILLSRATVSMVVAQFGFGWVIYMPITCLPQFLSDVLHLHILDNSALLALTILPRLAVLIAVSNIFDAIIRREWLQKNFLRKLYVAVAIVVFIGSFASIPAASCDTWLVIFLITLGMGFWQLSAVTYTVSPLDLTPEYSGTVTALFNVAKTTGGVVMPIAVDKVTTASTKVEWDRVFYLTCGIVATTGMIFLLLGTTERQRHWAENNRDDDSNEIANEMDPLVLHNPNK